MILQHFWFWWFLTKETDCCAVSCLPSWLPAALFFKFSLRLLLSIVPSSHLPTNIHLSNVRTADSSKASRLKDCRYSGFKELVLLSQVKLRYSVDILRWGCCFLVTFLRLSRQRLFHLSVPVWRTSSSQCQFVFHPDDKLKCWESSLLRYYLSRPTRHSWSCWAAAYTLK